MGQGTALSMMKGHHHPKQVSMAQALQGGFGWAAGFWLLLLLLSKCEVH